MSLSFLRHGRGWAFPLSHRANCATSRIVIFSSDNRRAGEEIGDERDNASHPDALGNDD